MQEWHYFYLFGRPLIYPDGDKIANFVKQHIVIEPFNSAEILESVFSGYPKFKILILNLDCTEL